MSEESEVSCEKDCPLTDEVMARMWAAADFPSHFFGALFPFFIVSSFLASTPDNHHSEVPLISFFHISQVITNKISLTFYKCVLPSVNNK